MAVTETLAVRVRSVASSGINRGAAALALAVPFLFLHIKYQPGVRVPLGSTHLGLELSDLAVVIVALFALMLGTYSRSSVGRGTAVPAQCRAARAQARPMIASITAAIASA